MSKYTLEELAEEYGRVSDVIISKDGNDAKELRYLNLYRDCVLEMLTEAARQACYEAWEDEEFRTQWKGTPFRYKRFQKAAFDWLPVGWDGCVTQRGEVILSFPVEGCRYSTRTQFNAHRFADWTFCDGGYNDQFFYFKPDCDCVRRELPNLNEVDTECRNAHAKKEDYYEYIKGAIDRVSDKVEESSCGLYALRETMRPHVQLDWRW